MKNPAKTRKKSSSDVTIRAGKHTATVPASALAPIEHRWDRILVPTDFSELSDAALQKALSMAELAGAGLVLMHVTEAVIYPSDWVYPMPPVDLPERRKDLLSRMEGLVARHQVPVKVVLREGRAWREICDLAAEERCDLIVMSTHGYSGIKRALLGSVAEMVVRHAPCTVLAIRPDRKKR